MRNKLCHLMGMDIVSQSVLGFLDSFGTTSTKFIFHLRSFKTNITSKKHLICIKIILKKVLFISCGIGKVAFSC